MFASFTARYYKILARLIFVGFGGAAIAWGIDTIPIFWRQAPIEYVARHIIRGEPYKIEALLRQMPEVEAAENSINCRPIALWSAAIIRLRMVEQAAATKKESLPTRRLMKILDNSIRALSFLLGR